jgi:hypothetical protein
LNQATINDEAMTNMLIINHESRQIARAREVAEGVSSLSTNRTGTLKHENSLAAVMPVGSAPTINTGLISLILFSREYELFDRYLCHHDHFLAYFIDDITTLTSWAEKLIWDKTEFT